MTGIAFYILFRYGLLYYRRLCLSQSKRFLLFDYSRLIVLVLIGLRLLVDRLREIRLIQ